MYTMIDRHEELQQTTRLSRRDFLGLCGASSAALVLTAYSYRASVPSPAIPVSPLPTPTYANHIYLPTVLSAYSIPINHVYLPIVSKGCPNPLLSPRPTEIVFEDDFDQGLEFSDCWTGEHDHWYSSWQKGAQYELVDHPGRGQVLRSWVAGERFLEDGQWWRRAQISWGIGCYGSLVTTPAPCAVSCDFWISDTLAHPGTPPCGILSCHTPRRQGQQPYYVAGFEVRQGGTKLALIHHAGVPGTRAEVFCDAIQLPINQWFNLVLMFEGDGRVLPYFNGVLAIRDPSSTLVVYPGFDIGIGDTHAGLIGAQPELTPEWEQGAFLLNDNFKVIRFPCG